MNRWRQIFPLSMAVVLTAMVPFTSFGATLSDYDEQTRARLQDNVLEYDELADLIAVYNPTVKSINDRMQEAIDDLNLTIGELETNVGELRRLASDRKDAGDMIGCRTYTGMADMIQKQSVKAMKDSVTGLNSHTGTSGVRSATNQLTSVTQGLMMTYQSLLTQRETVVKSKELAEAAYQSTLTQKSLNMVTDADVLNAKKSMEQAAGGLAKVDAGILNIKQNLCMLTGWGYDASPDIRPIPAVSQERIDAMNLETDIPKAIGNNADLIEQRSTTASAARKMTPNAKERRARSIEESEQKLHIEMEQLYDAVREKKVAADGAAAAYASAVTARNAADLKYQVGSIGRLEYLQAEVEYLSQQAAKESADMDLLQAVNSYEWAVKGILKIE